ncbi:class I SAM-dependent methyltransferase [Humidisolicoccus flavus]|uniref:class I SAM-dependent methyltransferase n=1 Tax=Humidisolicoccus flavus TaxID=3111414 RepID=UPI00324DED94
MPDFDFESLRRYPDVEAPNLFAFDASDRLILDTLSERLLADDSLRLDDRAVVVIGDRYGALTLGAPAAASMQERGLTHVRVSQDSRTGEQALAANARAVRSPGSFENHALGAALLEGARFVLLQLPRSLAELDSIAALIARHAHPDVVVIAGGRLKHMSRSMNEVLERSFSTVTATRAAQKSRALVASGPKSLSTETNLPKRAFHEDLGITVVAHGGAFAGTGIDIGTRFLLEQFDRLPEDGRTAIDLGCGTGVLAVALAKARPELTIIASDQSAAAVASAIETVRANELAERITVVRDNGLESQPDASADLIVCNPPFHSGAAVHEDVAHGLFEAAARVLRPGGQLWTVFNSHLGHPAALRELVGPTKIIDRNEKFTVARSTRPLELSGD